MDLNPNNYNLNEITVFFDLKPNHNFTQINDSFRKKHNEITLSSQVSKDEKDKMLFFIKLLKNKLVLHLSKQTVPNNTFSKSNGIISDNITNTNDQSDTIINSSNPIARTGIFKPVNPGSINPIERNVLTNVIHFDTRYKQNFVIENQTKFTFKFPTSFKNVISTKLLSFEVPDVIYNITDSLKNNTFYYNLKGDSNSTTSANEAIKEIQITIDEGKYSKDTLVAEFQKKINLENSGEPFTVSCDGPKFLFKIAHSTKNFNLRFPGIKDRLNLGYILGFRSENIDSKDKICEALKVADFDFNNYFYLSLNDYQMSVNQNHYAIMNKNFITKNIYAKIKNKQDDGNSDYFIRKNYFGPVTFERITFEILDRYGNALDLKGLDYSFSLEMQILYKY